MEKEVRVICPKEVIWPMSSTISNTFQMDVVDIFAFTDGRTVFVGRVTDGPALIKKCRCTLSFEGKGIQELEIEGEMLPEVRGHPTGLRSVSSLTKIALDDVRPEQRKLQLICRIE